MSEAVMLPVRIIGGPCDGQQIEVRATLTPMGRPALPVRIELLGEASPLSADGYWTPMPPRYTYDLTGPDSVAYRYAPPSAGPVHPDEEPTT